MPATGLWVDFSYTTGGIASADLENVSSSSIDVVVEFKQPGDLFPGVYPGDVELKICEDQQCSRIAGGSPVRIHAQMEVRALPLMSIAAVSGYNFGELDEVAPNDASWIPLALDVADAGS